MGIASFCVAIGDGVQVMTDRVPPFHLAFPVRDVAEARRFYVDLLGCGEGRSADEWVDLDFFGHQIVAHYKPSGDAESEVHHNPVDGSRNNSERSDQEAEKPLKQKGLGSNALMNPVPFVFPAALP